MIDSYYGTPLADCPFCGASASVGVIGTGTAEDNWWAVSCDHEINCVLVDLEVSSIEFHSLRDKWNRRVGK